jgi:hypothetical protein
LAYTSAALRCEGGPPQYSSIGSPTVATVEQREEAVLITGVFGAGKSSVAEEIADILEKRGASYAVLDLDWLAWFGPEDEHAHQRVLAQNLAAVAGNYRAAGVRFFVLAYAVPDEAQLESLTVALDMPVKVVRLTLSLSEIRKRLLADVTSGRQDDLREAAAWLATAKGTGFEGLTLPNDRPIREVASDILAWLGWAQ